MKRALKLVLSAIIVLSAPALAYAQDYDLVILNGRVCPPSALTGQIDLIA